MRSSRNLPGSCGAVLVCCASLAASLLFAGDLAAQQSHGKVPVDLELVLAIDASSSVDFAEYGLQLRGIASALRDKDVQGAIHSGPHGKIAVKVLVWAQHGYRKQETDWLVLQSVADAEALATLVQSLPRKQFGGTAMGEGLAAALHAIDSNSYDGERLVIDVSGDGRESEAMAADTILMPQARNMAQELGVVVNGLAITNEDPSLLGYYERDVRVGPDSFVIPAQSYRDIEEALRLKLFREIQYLPRFSVFEQN